MPFIKKSPSHHVSHAPFGAYQCKLATRMALNMGGANQSFVPFRSTPRHEWSRLRHLWLLFDSGGEKWPARHSLSRSAAHSIFATPAQRSLQVHRLKHARRL